VINDAQLIKDQDLHPMVRVMNDFYGVTDALSRPKIFAIVISPPDRKFYFDSGMLKLEAVLDAQVNGISDEKRAEIRALPDRPTEMVVLYDSPVRTVETRLFKELRQLDPNENLFRRHFRAARHALIEVGSCASDLIWRRALKEIEASVVPVYEEDEDDQDQSGLSSDRRRSKIRDIVKNWPFAMPNLHSSSRGFNITPKFLKLVKVLKSCEPYGDSFRGLVFGELRRCIDFLVLLAHLWTCTVQKGAVAHVLVDLIRTLGDQLAFIRPCAVVGHGPSVVSEQVRRSIFHTV
jgi:endoribonuclease Dicer